MRVYRKALTGYDGQASLGYQKGCRFIMLDREEDLPRNESSEHTLYHEIAHVLGMLHEHQREDRDTYIRLSLRHALRLDENPDYTP